MTLKIKSIEFRLSAPTAKLAHPDARPQIALAGRSNVGKSSLINTLANRRQLARVSNTPGRTREINLFLVNNDFYLADLPGYGFAKVSKTMKEAWGREVEIFLAAEPNLAGVVAIFDIRRDLRPDDAELLLWLAQHERPALAVITKVDKLAKNERQRRERAWAASLEGLISAPPISFSSLDATGLPVLLAAFEQLLAGKLAPAVPKFDA